MEFSLIREASQRLNGLVVRTPITESERLNGEVGARLIFKCENVQRTGAFKYRGATNAVQSLDRVQAAKGVATHSSGNHGAALARAARERGIHAHIVVPETALPAKVDAIKAYGGEIHFCEPTQVARETGLARVVADTGAEAVPPYDDERVIAGQGTAALELLEQAAGLDAIIAPVGGGGLISGTSIVAKNAPNAIKVYGAEPEGADDTYRSLVAGEIVKDFLPDTIADGLRARVGNVTFPLIQSGVDAVLPVSDEEIVSAMQLLWQRLRMICEPSCATVLAAIRRYPANFSGLKVGVILSGGNTDLDSLPWHSRNT